MILGHKMDFIFDVKQLGLSRQLHHELQEWFIIGIINNVYLAVHQHCNRVGSIQISGSNGFLFLRVKLRDPDLTWVIYNTL